MNTLAKRSYMSLVYVFLYTPIAILLLFSFNNSPRSLIWHGFSWQWYKHLFHDPHLLVIAGHSFFLAFMTAIMAVALGSLTAIFFYRYRIWGKTTWSGLLFLLIMIPDLILAVSFLTVFRLLSIPFGFWTLWIAHTSFCLPFVFVTVMGSLRKLHPSLLEAATDLGASDAQAIWHILIPALRPAIVMGGLMSFALSLDDVVISYFVSGPSFQVLPLKIYAMARLGASPEINALCSILFVITLALVLASHAQLKRRQT
jgi:spermidine/putrescine transport system permease protein